MWTCLSNGLSRHAVTQRRAVRPVGGHLQGDERIAGAGIQEDVAHDNRTLDQLHLRHCAGSSHARVWTQVNGGLYRALGLHHSFAMIVGSLRSHAQLGEPQQRHRGSHMSGVSVGT